MRITEHEDRSHIPSSGSWATLALRAAGAGLSRYKRWRTARRLENRVVVLLDEFSLYLEAPDRGRADFRLHIANFSGVLVELKHIELHHWQLANRYMGEQQGLLKAKGSAEPRTLGQGSFSVGLGSADIRTIVNAVEPSQNTRSAPSARLEADGLCVLVAKRREVRVRFALLREHTGIILPTHVLDQISPPK